MGYESTELTVFLLPANRMWSIYRLIWSVCALTDVLDGAVIARSKTVCTMWQRFIYCVSQSQLGVFLFFMYFFLHHTTGSAFCVRFAYMNTL